jgi:hypothetical protein
MSAAPLRPCRLKSFAVESALVQHLMLKTVEDVGKWYAFIDRRRVK